MEPTFTERPNAEPLPPSGPAGTILDGHYAPPPADKDGKIWVRTSALVLRPPDELYVLWRDLAKIPDWQEQILEVRVTGPRSGSGKSTLISQALIDLVSAQLGHRFDTEEDVNELEAAPAIQTSGEIAGGLRGIRRLVVVDQKPIGRTPRSNMATYTGLFDYVRILFAQTKLAKARKYDAGRFSFNVAKGCCETCSGEGFVCVELLFLPSVYSPCPTCKGSRFNSKALEVSYRDKNIAEVLGMTVDEALIFFASDPSVSRALKVLRDVGLGYLRLGQSATELSGGEAQRIKLATELQRMGRADTLYILDEPTTGLHPSDVCRLVAQLQTLVENGNTVLVVEHDMDVITASDWIIDIGPKAGDEGGKVIAFGPPEEVAKNEMSRTARYLAERLRDAPVASNP